MNTAEPLKAGAMVVIYGLRPKWSGLGFAYIGQTKQPEARLAQHRSGQSGNGNERLAEWIAGVEASGGQVELVPIAIVPHGRNAHAVESAFIQAYKLAGQADFNRSYWGSETLTEPREISASSIASQPCERERKTKAQRDPAVAEYLHPEDAAALLGLQASTLAKWREHRSDGPPFVRLGGRAIRYPRAQLLQWADKHATEKNTRGAR